MALAQLGGPLTMTGTAKSIATWFSYGAQQHAIRTLILKAKAGNTAAVYVGKDSTVSSAGANAIHALLATATTSETLVIPLIGMTYADNIWLVGTNNDVVYVWIME